MTKEKNITLILFCHQRVPRIKNITENNWARLIQKIYEIDPLTCPKCQGPMRVIAFIGKGDAIKEIPRGGQALKHLGLWEVKRKLIYEYFVLNQDILTNDSTR
jgi:hypothetical protein